VATLPAYAPATDTTQSLEWRVRSYFAVNCSQCHQPGGPASGNWDARSTVELDSAQIINGVLLNNYGDTANRFVVPGDATHSIALKRLNGIPSRMPPVGSNVIDQGAIDLITQWLNGPLPSRQSFAQWQVAQFGNPLPAQSGPDDDPDGDGIRNRAEFLAGTNPKAGDPAPLRISRSGSQLRFEANLPANRSMVIETSPTLAADSWTPWNVPGNAPSFPAAAGTRTLEAPQPGAARQFFRARIASP
jgi:mono/diheme cytochrome c family protein